MRVSSPGIVASYVVHANCTPLLTSGLCAMAASLSLLRRRSYRGCTAACTCSQQLDRDTLRRRLPGGYVFSDGYAANG